MESNKQLSRPGFTIVELLVVIVIIGILAAITIVSYTGISNRATVASLTSDLTNASTQLKLDQTINGLYPNDLASANGGKGIPASAGTTYQYSYNNNVSPQTFCITATKGTTSYKTTNDSSPVVGDCFNYGLILYLDAGNSSSYPGSGTTWTNLIGSGNNGALMNGVGYSSSNGGALSFDGVDDYVDCGTISPLTSYSAEAWVKMNKLSGGNGDQTAYGFTIMATSSNYGLWLTAGISGSTEAALRAFSSNVTGYATTNANLNTSNWFDIVATATEGSTSKIYVNGVEKLSFVAADNVNWDGTLTIGDLRPNRLIGFSGLISNVKLYNRVLSAADVQQNFNALRGRYGI